MNRIKVDTVEEAVRAADELRRSGGTWWFRGQTQDWPLRSSLVRVKDEGRRLSLEKLSRYEGWTKSTPGLEVLAANVDASIAVAQHYGLPTNFIDFTTDPQIAGFFAAERQYPDAANSVACIICLDVEDLKEFWEGLPPKYPPPEFLEMTVPDLWRLEAQRGCFLFCPYDNIEKIYDFDRIYFPNSHPSLGLKREDVYPSRKSQLEILLDQYFMNEELVEAARRPSPSGFTTIVFDRPDDGCSHDLFPEGIPDHPSWSTSALAPWLELRAERLDAARSTLNVSLELQSGLEKEVARSVADQVDRELFVLAGIRGKLVSWSVELVGDHDLPEDFEARLAPRLARLWDGLRRLPHNDRDVSVGLGTCVSLAVALRGDYGNPDGSLWERAAQECLASAIPLEFGADDGSYSRGYASTAALTGALRSDILSYVTEEWRDQLANNVRSILLAAPRPRKVFDLQLLTPVFAREIAPYQVLARESAVFYSPARLASLGLP